jgi:hypothetical protein
MVRFKKWILIAVLSLTLLISGCITHTREKEDVVKNGTFQVTTIEDRISSILPENWIISNITMNTVPIEYDGPATCIGVSLEDPSVVWTEEFGGFNYTSFITLWFCPEGWNGTQKEIQVTEQRYPALMLIDNGEYSIMYLTLGNTTAPDLLDKLKEEFD